MNNVFNIEKIEKRIKELKELPRFTPDSDEPVFSVTHTIDDKKMTAKWVFRNGDMLIFDIYEEGKQKSEYPKPYKDEKFCEHCQKDTEHTMMDSGHERDSSGDTFECLTCHWSGTWMDPDNYYPPNDEKEDNE